MRRMISTLMLLGALAPGLRAQDPAPAASEAPSADEQAVRDRSAALVAAFNAGRPADAAAMFLPEAELVDEDGNLYRGREEVADLLKRFFDQYPGSTFTQEVELVRVIGPALALEDGTRVITAKDGEATTRFRYLTVWSRVDDSWRIVTTRQYQEDLPPTPHERLLPLAWMIGEWIDESEEAVIALSCRWSDDENYLLRDFTVTVAGEVVLDTTQRIGWDPLTNKIKSWAFDSDGSHAEGYWTEIEGQWVVKTTAVLPGGETASATIVYEPIDEDSFVMRGLDRIVGDVYEPDFEATIVRRPPAPAGGE